MIQYTYLDPAFPAGAVVLANCFISQLLTDMRKKLKKAEDGPHSRVGENGF